jgi:predicted SnoaL-like aldol condensation-catalyzing enzyme
MAAAKNKTSVTRFYNACFDHNNQDHLDDLIDTNFVGHISPSANVYSFKDLKDHYRSIKTRLGAEHDIESRVAQGDTVVTQLALKYKNQGKQKRETIVSVSRFSDEKLVEHWTNVDLTTGLVPVR